MTESPQKRPSTASRPLTVDGGSERRTGRRSTLPMSVEGPSLGVEETTTAQRYRVLGNSLNVAVVARLMEIMFGKT